jgi:hypothetical protein
MPQVKLTEALLEQDEDRETREDVDNLLSYGTDDRAQVKKLEGQMRADLESSFREPTDFWEYLDQRMLCDEPLIEDESEYFVEQERIEQEERQQRERQWRDRVANALEEYDDG